jgi:CheY-like chemotaxis protein
MLAPSVSSFQTGDVAAFQGIARPPLDQPGQGRRIARDALGRRKTQGSLMTQAPQVLVVDDSQSIRQAVRVMLEPHGYHVREASDGDEGLEAIRAESDPMIVLLDYQMERMDGGEVLKTVASEGGPLLKHEYIMITAVANTFPPDFIELLRSLSIRVLQKPFDEQALTPAVEGAVERLNAPPDEPLPWAPEA